MRWFVDPDIAMEHIGEDAAKQIIRPEIFQFEQGYTLLSFEQGKVWNLGSVVRTGK